ncbi:MAG: hypothetical protein JWP87_1762 [Labilithrix sp.]|nr:hypothetical protein [Labilithrix sp.]
MAKPRNDRNQAVTKFCLSMEDHRRTEAGRVRTSKEFVSHFFPYDEQKSKDQLFLHMPNDVRGPVLAKWGIRGAKAALKDDDEKVKFVVHDALVAGDIDEAIFEEGITPEILIDWIVLAEWWSFWRHGRLTGVAIQKALATARELGLIDDKWFLLNVQGRGGKLKGTDVLCDTLSKDQIVAWIRKLHEGGDGSPAGIIAAIGWDTVLAKTAQDALLFALDQFARKAGLAPEAPESARTSLGPNGESKASSGGAAGAGGAAPPSSLSAGIASNPEPATAKHDKLAEAHPTISVPGDAAALAAAEAIAAQSEAPPVTKPNNDSGFPVAIPDIPAVDGGDDGDDVPPSIPSVRTGEERSMWSPGQVEESPKLAEARAAMMQTLMSNEKAIAHEMKREPWDESEIPAKPSSLEWPEPPPVVAVNGGSSPPSDPPISLGEDDLQKASSPKVPVPHPPPVPRKGGPPPRPR